MGLLFNRIYNYLHCTTARVTKTGEPSGQLKMKLIGGLYLLLAITATLVSAAEKSKVTKLQIGVKKRVENCEMKSRKGDKLSMHYTGTLHSDGSQFDSSLDRGEPLSFTLGAGQVIKGWDQGLLAMCVGEKRKLVIPADLGYGDTGAGEKIPGGATLVFEVELVNIDRKSEL